MGFKSGAGAAVLVVCMMSVSGMSTAQEREGAADGRDALLAQVSSTFAQAELHTGADSDAPYEAVRKLLVEGPFAAAYEAAMAQRHGAACGSLGLEDALNQLMNDIVAAARGSTEREKGISHYLMRVQMSCSRRVREDSALFTAIWKAIESAKPLRAQRYAEYVDKERQAAALREEERARIAAAEARKAAEERERLESERVAAQAAAKLAAEQQAADAVAGAASGPVTFAAGTFRCVAGDQNRVLHFGAAGELVELVHAADMVLGYAGMYQAIGERVLIRYVADNAWKVFAVGYEQAVADEFAWKRSAIATQKVTEFRMRPGASGAFRPEAVRTKLLKSGEITEGKRPECRRLQPTDPGAKAAEAHARLAMRYVDMENDRAPARLDDAKLSLAAEIEIKKTKELEWFKRAPGLLKMMATDRLLTELRKSSNAKCAGPKAAFETGAAAAMKAINQIGESELAMSNPARAEQVAGRQLEPAFEQFIDQASRLDCVMEESSAVGL